MEFVFVYCLVVDGTSRAYLRIRDAMTRDDERTRTVLVV